jgi:RNA polymerase sigma-70 factor, ECF subfamily
MSFRDRPPGAGALRMTHDEEVILVERLRRHDPVALANLYDRYGRLTYSLIVRIVRDIGVAEDLTQETFLRVWTSVGRFDAGRAFRPWLLTVARNRAIDYLRASDDRWNYGSAKLDQTEDPKLFADVEKGIAISGKLGTLRGALEKLSVNQRRVIDLAYFEGHSQTEIAAKLDSPSVPSSPGSGVPCISSAKKFGCRRRWNRAGSHQERPGVRSIRIDYSRIRKPARLPLWAAALSAARSETPTFPLPNWCLSRAWASDRVDAHDFPQE